jgi:chitin disaccharide deacetylase
MTARNSMRPSDMTSERKNAAAVVQTADRPGQGALIINADDWGRNKETTDRIFDCVARGTVSSGSAMVFMEDSERAAEIARERGVDTGLHLNFTTKFSGANVPARLLERQEETIAYLTRRRFNQTIFQPRLTRAFEYLVEAQLSEYERIYGVQPQRLDGHHHMHLCANVMRQQLMPAGTIARRNFTFRGGEKNIVNRLYRKFVDGRLARRHRIVDFLFSMVPLEPAERLKHILSLARDHVVEVETHPVNPDEYRFLMEEGVGRWTEGFPISPRFRDPANPYLASSQANGNPSVIRGGA